MTIYPMSSAQVCTSLVLGLTVACLTAPSAAQTEQAKLLAPDRKPGDEFANAVALQGDTAVVASWLGGGTAIGLGSVYVYGRDEGGAEAWGFMHQILADDRDIPGLTGEFGFAVALHNDTIVVGATGDNEVAVLAGAVYVFDRNLGGPDAWGAVRKLFASDGASFNEFGHDVAIDGDLLAVAARLAAGPDPLDGAVYLFERNEGGADNWGEIAKLTAPDLGQHVTQFGHAVAVSGDVVAVGSPQSSGAAFASGTVFLFGRNQGGPNAWGFIRQINAPAGDSGDWFGHDVALQGEVLVVGAPRDDDTLPQDENCDSGAAFIFNRDEGGPGNWGARAKIWASNDANDGTVGTCAELFGWSVAISGTTVIVGGSEDPNICIDNPSDCGAGTAYVFRRDAVAPGAWDEVASIEASDGVAGDLYGVAVAVDGDTALIGARGENADEAGAFSEGAAYIVEGVTSGIIRTDPCPADFDDSGAVDIDDFLRLLGEWGPCAATCVADTDGDGTVGIDDFLRLLGDWGPCA